MLFEAHNYEAILKMEPCVDKGLWYFIYIGVTYPNTRVSSYVKQLFRKCYKWQLYLFSDYFALHTYVNLKMFSK